MKVHTTIEDAAARVICERCLLADGPLSRLTGLLGRGDLPAAEGVLLRPTSSIHTGFMRVPIDVVFLGPRLEVLSVRNAMGPWRMAWCRGAKSVLELAAGEAVRRDIQSGDRLRMVPPKVGVARAS